MKLAIGIGVVLALFLIGDVLFNHGKIAHGIQQSFYKSMTGD